ncbi:phosphomevalonate kinase [Amphibacillus cookii]|uniref:phosphomevalonate kinase n=1 Tax=Amphibacillus cookii TaxID=767787 RepID=UPI00195E00EA|nr:phosphomevalonate kinase [Amphibacillus cookii]MBM7543091.1 phosphomevalonate kinase [Amphibacillus cookii]
MNAQRYTVRAPGKLFIAGEYAITEHQSEGIVVAVDRYLTVDIQSHRNNRLDLPQLGLTDLTWKVEDGEVKFSKKDKRLAFIKQVIETINDYVGELPTVHVFITSELDKRSGEKYGLGSSAALSVALVAALLLYTDEKHSDRLTIFKLASIAHFKTQGNGSCADIAASTYGGWLNYRTFDSDWLTNQLEHNPSTIDIVQKKWPYLQMKPLTLPNGLHFLMGWTGEAAATAPMVTKISKLKESDTERYHVFLNQTQAAVARILQGFQTDDVKPLLAGIKANRQALKGIGIDADVPIESPTLEKLIEIASPYGAAKTSGAGGGDCGIAFINQLSDVEFVCNKWRENGIEPLNLSVSRQGVTVD